MYAGAQSVCVSLWNVNDRATADLMTRFYGSMLGGVPPAVALQTAQIDLLTGQRRHPFFWAPFVLLGDTLTPIDGLH
jgi:CHAT domain-containing protein